MDNGPHWNEYKLTDLAFYHNGFGFKPNDWSTDGTRIIRIEQLNNPDGYYDHYQGPISEINAIEDGDLVFSWSATLKVAIWRHGKAVLNQHLFKVVPKSGFDKVFLYYLLDFHMPALSGGSHGSTMKHIKRGELERYKVHVPGFSVQVRIGKLIGWLDEGIRQTERLISKYQQIKSGLMRDLFTRGVTPDGRLRPSREEAPDIYWKSPIGWVPKDWNVCDTDQVCSVIDPQPDHRTPSEVLGGIPYVGIGDMGSEGTINFLGARKVSREAFEKQRRMFQIFPGAFIFGKIGTIGSPTFIPHERFFALSANVILITSEMELDSRFLFWIFNSDFIDKQVIDSTNTTSQPALGIQKIRKFRVPWPKSQGERVSIHERLTSVAHAITVETRYLEKLHFQKYGLMRDLLTGRVAVSV